MSSKHDRWQRKRAKRNKKSAPRPAQAGETTVDTQGGVSIGKKSVSPADGALVVTCGHEGGGHSFHWCHEPNNLMVFTRPDGSTGESHWMAACDPCFLKANGDADKIEFRSDFEWDAQGGKPMPIRNPDRH